MVSPGTGGSTLAVRWITMSRVIAVTACGFILAACSMSMPSLDFFRSGPTTEVLRIESEPPGADARTAEGASCRTPCELTVPTTGEVAISFALPGHQPQTVAVRSDGTSPPRMQPNPVYAELQPMAPPRPQKKKKAPAKKKVAKKAPPSPAPDADPAPPPPPPQTQGGGGSPSPYPPNYPWPPPPPPQ
jgi:hypothetical protein